MTCLPCEVALARRQNAALRGVDKHWQSLPSKCDLHSALASARTENTLRTAQALHEQVDAECRTAEKRNGKAFAVARVLAFPFGAPRTACHPSRLPLQGETTQAWAVNSGLSESKRTHELRLLGEAVASGMVCRVG